MAKQRSFDEILADFQKVQAELEQAKGARVAELTEQAKILGYKLVLLDTPEKKATGGKVKLDRDAARAWLETTLKDGPVAKGDLQKRFRDHFQGNRLRIDGWKDLLKEDSKGNVVLK